MAEKPLRVSKSRLNPGMPLEHQTSDHLQHPTATGSEAGLDLRPSFSTSGSQLSPRYLAVEIKFILDGQTDSWGASLIAETTAVTAQS